MMLEKERLQWQANFANRLREADRKSFVHLWEKVFHLADAASANTRPIVFDNVIMSMLVSQQTEIQRLKNELAQLKKQLE
jgi:hypothetical protein